MPNDGRDWVIPLLSFHQVTSVARILHSEERKNECAPAIRAQMGADDAQGEEADHGEQDDDATDCRCRIGSLSASIGSRPHRVACSPPLCTTIT